MTRTETAPAPLRGNASRRADPRAARRAALVQGMASGGRAPVLMNNLDPEGAESRRDLVVYAHGRAAAAGPTTSHRLVAPVARERQTLLVQSGKPVAW